MARALKTFRYSDGFHAWTVATTSRAKALQAWGVKRDLFKDGSAEEIDAGPDREAALKAPGELVERGLSVDVGKVGKATPRRAKPRPSAKARARVEALEIELAALDETQAEERADLEGRRRALEAEASALAKRQARARDAVKARLNTARAKL